MKSITPLWLGIALLAAPPAFAQATDPGRLLASNCFQCHGTGGTADGFDKIGGESAKSTFEKLKEMQTKSAGNNIMRVHARGYTDEQIRLLAGYLAKQKR